MFVISTRVIKWSCQLFLSFTPADGFFSVFWSDKFMNTIATLITFSAALNQEISGTKWRVLNPVLKPVELPPLVSLIFSSEAKVTVVRQFCKISNVLTESETIAVGTRTSVISLRQCKWLLYCQNKPSRWSPRLSSSKSVGVTYEVVLLSVEPQIITGQCN